MIKELDTSEQLNNNNNNTRHNLDHLSPSCVHSTGTNCTPVTMKPSPTPSSNSKLFILQNRNSVPLDCSSLLSPSPCNHPSTFWICPFEGPPVSGITQNLSGFVWLLSLSTASSRFIRVAAGVRTSFLFKAESPAIAGPDGIVLAHCPLVDTWLASVQGCCDHCCCECGCTDSFF